MPEIASKAPQILGDFKMEKLIVLALAVFLSANAFGYSTPVGSDPIQGTHDQEFKQIVKSTVSGESSSITRGNVLSYAAVVDGYTVTRIGAAATSVTGQALVACIAARDVATGNVNYVPCVTKGFVDFLKYDATVAIVAGAKLCTNTEGVAVACNNPAASASSIIALEAKASGTGSNLKAMVNLR